MKAPKNKPQWFLIGGSLTGLIAASLAQSGLCPQLFPLAGYLQILSVSTLSVSLLYKRPTSYQVKQHCPAIPLAAGQCCFT